MLNPLPPPAEQQAAALAALNPGEQKLFRRMRGSDQRHAINVATRLRHWIEAQPDVDPEVSATLVQCALMHDVGKSVVGFGVVGRTAATMIGAMVGEDFAIAYEQKSGFTRRVGLYMRYGFHGSEMLQLADSHQWVIAWSEQHHWERDRWTIPERFGEALMAADG